MFHHYQYKEKRIVYRISEANASEIQETNEEIFVQYNTQWHHNLKTQGDNSLNIECDIRRRRRGIGTDKTLTIGKGNMAPKGIRDKTIKFWIGGSCHYTH